MINWSHKSILLVQVNYLKKLTTTQKLKKLKRKYLTMINTILLTNLTDQKKENFDEKLIQANLTSKNNVEDFVKKTDFDDRLTSNKTKQVDADKKLTYPVTSHTKLINDLSREVKTNINKRVNKRID